MSRVTLTIEGVPEFRASLALESRRKLKRAAEALGYVPEQPCCYILVDRMGHRPSVERWFDRAQGWKQPEDLFEHELLAELQPGTSFEVRPAGKPPRVVPGIFRHKVHFAAVEEYRPKTQAQLDDMRRRREEKQAEREREAAPLFAEGGR